MSNSKGSSVIVPLFPNQFEFVREGTDPHLCANTTDEAEAAVTAELPNVESLAIVDSTPAVEATPIDPLRALAQRFLEEEGIDGLTVDDVLDDPDTRKSLEARLDREEQRRQAEEMAKVAAEAKKQREEEAKRQAEEKAAAEAKRLAALAKLKAKVAADLPDPVKIATEHPLVPMTVVMHEQAKSLLEAFFLLCVQVLAGFKRDQEKFGQLATHQILLKTALQERSSSLRQILMFFGHTAESLKTLPQITTQTRVTLAQLLHTADTTFYSRAFGERLPKPRMLGHRIDDFETACQRFPTVPSFLLLETSGSLMAMRRALIQAQNQLGADVNGPLTAVDEALRLGYGFERVDFKDDRYFATRDESNRVVEALYDAEHPWLEVLRELSWVHEALKRLAKRPTFVTDSTVKGPSAQQLKNRSDRQTKDRELRSAMKGSTNGGGGKKGGNNKKK